MMENTLRLVQPNEARVNVTFDGQIGDLPDPVSFDATDADVKQWVTEAVRTGGVTGIPAAARADFTDFVVERFARNEQRLDNIIMLRPKTPFGTDRINALVVVLNKDYREDDVDAIVNAIKMVKGVQGVEANVANIGDHIAYTRAHTEIAQRLMRVLAEPKPE